MYCLDGRWQTQARDRCNCGDISSPQIREGSASDSDIQKLRSFVVEPAFQKAAKSNWPGLSISNPEGRIIFVETVFEGKLETVSFVDGNGKTPIPDYLKPLLIFSEEVKDRRIPKLSGKNKPVCHALTRH
jgi:hypothetical protein